ncbi:MAG TPA: DNA helicase UvrD, partial [Firmicutes bacterium]|nr:DNA helicase UvrD [Bacillota bacterium]
MKFWADLHLHSRYSMATSKDSNPEKLVHWAGRKGLALIGTGDLTH